MAFKCKIGFHTWNGCNCSECGQTRDVQHDWKDCKCSKCGKTRDEQHDWSINCEKCSKCGQAREEQHDWLKNEQIIGIERCKKCGQLRVIIDWIEIPAGKFIIGKPESLESLFNERFTVEKEITMNSFKMSKYAITFDQYDLFCKATNRRKPWDEGWGRGNRPVINVYWKDAKDFADWMGCRLPTETEWEYACRAGTTTPFNTGEELTTSQANYDGKHPYNKQPYLKNDEGELRGQTLPVGSFQPNALGLYDMHGNVDEWCCTWIEDPNDYPSYTISNRVVRGGAFNSCAAGCRSANRFGIGPEFSRKDVGFRLVSQ